MAAYLEMDTDCELEYEVAACVQREVHRLPRRYSPRFEKQRAPQHMHGGVHRRGRRNRLACHAS